MSDTINIYCDESCHLQHDRIPFMALGAVWCNADQAKPIADRIRELKNAFGLFEPSQISRGTGSVFETKWTKVSPAGVDFYLALVNYFFDDDDLHFRAVLIDKRILNHDEYRQTHQDWYYKMMFVLLDQIIDPRKRNNVYLDIKDTRSEVKRAKLDDCLKTSRRDGTGSIIHRVQQIRSHESELLQLTDMLLGAVVYQNRIKYGDLAEKPRHSEAKLNLIRRIQKRARTSLDHSTWQREQKFNILKWAPTL